MEDAAQGGPLSTMVIPLRHILTSVRNSLWFVPALMVTASVLLAGLMMHLDVSVTLQLADRFPRLFGANAQAGRDILAAIAGSMITVAGVTFSVTIVALSLASNQYTSRILRNYMRDRGNQLVLGMFVSVFVYCVLVLRAIRGGEDAFIPSYSLFTGMLLGLVAIGFLIYFIHHIATSIQVSTILANVHRETMAAIDAMLARHCGREPMHEDCRPAPGGTVVEVQAHATGYLQDVDEEKLIQWAAGHGVVLEMSCSVGDFVVRDGPLLRIHGMAQVTDEDCIALCRCHGISTTRTIEQDPAYGLRQIVDIALKALSPGINDSTTAVSCVDYLGAIVFRLMPLDLPSELVGSSGKLRLIARRATFPYLLDLAFNEIRQHGGPNVAIYLHLLHTLTGLASAPSASPHLASIGRHVNLVAESARLRLQVGGDLAAIDAMLERAARAMERTAGRNPQADA